MHRRAFEKKDQEFLDYIIPTFKINLNEQNEKQDGKTLLNYIYNFKQYEGSDHDCLNKLAIHLIKLGARVDIKDNDGKNFIDLVIQQKDYNMVKFLQANGLDMMRHLPQEMLDHPSIKATAHESFEENFVTKQKSIIYEAGNQTDKYNLSQELHTNNNSSVIHDEL